MFAGRNVVKIAKSTGSVEVITQNGETFTGDILVGADGVHSTIRRQMWNMANKEEPGYFPPDEASSMVPFHFNIYPSLSRSY